MATKRITIDAPGSKGIIRDVDPLLLPPEAWTEGNNIRFNNGIVEKILGEEAAFTPSTTDTQFILPVVKWSATVPTNGWLYAGLDKVYFTDSGSSSTNITRQSTGVDVDYTGTVTDRWNGCQNQNIVILNNGVDAPQSWTATGKLEDLRWDAADTWEEKGYTTKVIRNFKNFLIALQFNDGVNGMNPNTVYWSQPAEPWAVPTSWDTTDTSKIAGKIELSSTEGEILDGLALRDGFMVYKNSSMYFMQLVGGNYVWKIYDVSKVTGIIAQNAVAEFLNQHIFFAHDDILTTDGNQLISVVNQKVRTRIFSEIDTTYYYKSFVVPYHNKQEMWFCYPANGASYCNRAAVWNYVSGTWSFRDLPNVNFINYGQVLNPNVQSTWNSDTQKWYEDTTKWNSSNLGAVVNRLMGCTDTTIKNFDTSYTFTGTGYESYVERLWLKLGESDTIRRITAIYPKCEGEVDVYVGRAMHQNDAFMWEGPFTITPETDAQIRCRVTGRYHAIRFVFKGNTAHKLTSYDIEYVDTGYGR